MWEVQKTNRIFTVSKGNVQMRFVINVSKHVFDDRSINEC